jgi:hypothetical protein
MRGIGCWRSWGAIETLLARATEDFRAGRHRADEPDVAAHDRARPDDRVPPQDGGAGVDGDVVLERGVALFLRPSWSHSRRRVLSAPSVTPWYSLTLLPMRLVSPTTVPVP